jgi:hypothetical protein
MTPRTALPLVLILGACKPDLSQDDWLIASTRVLAVKSEPAEAKPGTPLTFTTLIANPLDASDASTITWQFCTAPKPPTGNNVVSAECLDASSLTDAGTGSSIVAATPVNACSLFGPSTPPGGFRPRDPDETGGYYQPLRIDVPGTVPTFHLERVLCDLADASIDIATEFGKEYVPNANPHFAPITATMGGNPVSLDGIPKSASVELEARWTAADVESYAYYDRSSQTIITKRESMRVAWYVTAGRLDTESTGRDGYDLSTVTSNVWTAPSTPGITKLWLVLRDSRGGVDYTTYDLTVIP